MTSLTEALLASVRGVTFLAYSFRSGRSGSLGNSPPTAAPRRASADLVADRVRRSDMSEIGGEAEVRGLR